MSISRDFKKKWVEITKKYKQLGPLPKQPDLPIFAGWQRDFYTIDYGGDKYLCRAGQCIPFDQFKQNLQFKSFDKTRDVIKKD